MSALLLALGVGLIALSVWASRRGGTRARSARLMAGLAPVSPEEALLVGEDRYLAVQGSIDAAEAFDDENHRPLVYRRERVLVREGDTWRELERAVRSVQFFVASSSASIEVDAALLGDGLVVIERQWEGSVAELVASGRSFKEAATFVAKYAPGTTAPKNRWVESRMETFKKDNNEAYLDLVLELKGDEIVALLFMQETVPLTADQISKVAKAHLPITNWRLAQKVPLTPDLLDELAETPSFSYDTYGSHEEKLDFGQWAGETTSGYRVASYPQGL
jgi:hypothetical protein